MVERRGGRYLARTGAAETIEGERKPAQTMLIIEWPSRQVAHEFYRARSTGPTEQRAGGARNQFFLVAGGDFSGVASVQG